MRPFVMSVETQKRVNAVVEFASKPVNWWRVGLHKWSPGDNNEFVLDLGTFRTVFTFTVPPAKDAVYRHLSVSIPRQGKFPNPVILWTIAKMFGFTGAVEKSDMVVAPGKDWMMEVEKDNNCVIVAQKIPGLQPA